ncbi:hypothetical protein PROFUN_05111 [Planoprotostelium fungivorum]|uniref:Thioredoxin-like protein 4B n=1 Tax=Planoprotostelium fungivorum TaxID=1890364 RepID=A0A2P6NRN1_9EUKA|nr:hypothetical protein PROFUN_05111 [Planoprotostelium fungivorum]
MSFLRGDQTIGTHQMSGLLRRLRNKEEIDHVILNTEDKVLVLRFGEANDITCMRLDETLRKTEGELSKMAEIFVIEATDVPDYTNYFDITLIPATIFFFNTVHLKCDYGTPDNTKWIGAFHTKQDLIDLIECFYRGAMRGKPIITSPIIPSHVPQYTLLYMDI